MLWDVPKSCVLSNRRLLCHNTQPYVYTFSLHAKADAELFFIFYACLGDMLVDDIRSDQYGLERVDLASDWRGEDQINC